MRFKGAVTIFRTSNDTVQIKIEDKDAGIQFVVAEMSVADFGKAITGCGYVAAMVEARGLGLVGTVREHKDEIVPCEWSPKDKAAVLAPFEVDGWVAFAADLGNSHRRTSNPDGYRVSFSRNVPKVA